MKSFAPAKVNLFLHVTGRRDDGYHLLDSLAVFPAVGDRLSVVPAVGLGLDIGGGFGEGLAAEADNLVLRAARLLAAAAGLNARGRLQLEKNLPVASGIGGGSADAAAALRLLARFWGVAADLPALAAGLGADVPVCLARTARRMGGVGGVLSNAPALPAFGIMLVNPLLPVATAAVFKARQGAFSAPAHLPAAWTDVSAMVRDLSVLSNDLEAPALAVQPVIGRVLAALRAVPEVLLARMSGSGATCFALLETPAAAQAAALALARPGWWCWGGGLYEAGPDDL